MAKTDLKGVIHVDGKTKQRVAYLRKITGLTQSQLVSDLVNAVFTIGATYRKGANLTYDFCITDSEVTIRVNGSNRLIAASSFEIPENLPQEEAEKMVHSQLEAKITAKKVKGDKI